MRSVKSVINGTCSEELGRRNPGKMAHSRWLTTANQILRLYVSTANPSPAFRLLTIFILQAYVPVWFAIKTKPSCEDGSKHFHKLIKLTRQLPNEVKAAIDPVIQRNAYVAHSENMLLAMVADERPHIRQLGLRCIIKARSQVITGVRQFRPPKINVTATMLRHHLYFPKFHWMRYPAECLKAMLNCYIFSGWPHLQGFFSMRSPHFKIKSSFLPAFFIQRTRRATHF
jgi:hypothetical protein